LCYSNPKCILSLKFSLSLLIVFFHERKDCVGSTILDNATLYLHMSQLDIVSFSRPNSNQVEKIISLVFGYQLNLTNNNLIVKQMFSIKMRNFKSCSYEISVNTSAILPILFTFNQKFVFSWSKFAQIAKIIFISFYFSQIISGMLKILHTHYLTL